VHRPDPVARRVLDAYAAAGRRARLHTTLRWWTCPFDAVERLIPSDATVLDVGCGHGHFDMYLALTAPGRHVLGIDIDSAKVSIGTSVLTRAGLGGRVELRAVRPEWRPEPSSFDAVVVNDVLYLMGRETAAEVLATSAQAVRPGGVVVVKEVGTSPAWKRRLNAAQEQLATRVLHITAGADLDVLPEALIESSLSAAGLDVVSHRLDRGYPHAHVAVVGTRT